MSLLIKSNLLQGLRLLPSRKGAALFFKNKSVKKLKKFLNNTKKIYYERPV